MNDRAQFEIFKPTDPPLAPVQRKFRKQGEFADVALEGSRFSAE
jgi:hypothetical protein